MYQGGWSPAGQMPPPHDPYAMYNMAGPPHAVHQDDQTAEGGKCQRKEPPCKYLHPEQHLKEQLLQNGRQNLAINRSTDQARMLYNRYHWNQVLAQNQIAAASQIPTAAPMMPGMAGIPMHGMAGHIAMDGNRYLSHAAHAAASAAAANAGVLHTGLTSQPLITPNPYLYNQYAGLQAANPMSAAALGQLPLQFAVSQALAQIPNTSSSTTPSMNGQKTPRADRLEVCPEFSKEGTCPVPDSDCDRAHPPDYVLTEDDLAVVCMDFVKGKCTREHCKYYHPTPKLLAKVNQNRAALAAANQANTHAAQQALSQVLAAAALHQAPVQTPQSLLGLGQNQSVSVASALPPGMPQVSQASLNAYNMASYPYSNPALGMQAMHAGLAGATAGLAGAYQTGLATSAAGHLSAAAGGAPGSLQAVAAAASSAATQDVLSQQQQQQQAKKRTREDELLLPMQVPGMGVPIKRQALDATKGGIPMFNPAAYQQLAYAPQQPTYVPVSFYGYDMSQHTPTYVVAGHPAGVQRL